MPSPDAWLVLGGAGFIGSHIVDLLLARGERCVVVDDLSSRYSDPGKREGVELIVDDAASDRVLELLGERRFAAVLHLAGSAYVPPSVEDPAMDFDANLVLPLRLLLRLRELDAPPPFVLASSAAVYGDPSEMPIRDDTPSDPISPYGVSKLAAERYLSVFANLYGIRAASLRLFSVYGPRQRKQVVFDLIRKTLADPGEVEILGDGTQSRDLVYVGDVARAFVEVAQSAPLSGETYNVATGRAVTTAQLGRTIARCLGLNPRFRFTGATRPGDPQHWRGDATRLTSLGIAVDASLDGGIPPTVAWARDCLAEVGSAAG